MTGPHRHRRQECGGRRVTTVRDDAVAAGITVNGRPIVEVEPLPDEYHRRNVIGGLGCSSNWRDAAADIREPRRAASLR